MHLLVAAATSTPTVIIIDEFTGINSVAGAAGLLRTFSAFDQSEQAVLRALASQRPVFGGSLELYGSSSGGATAGRDRLVADGTLSRQDHEIIDPFLADWIRLRFAL